MPVLLYKFSEQTLQPGPSVSLKCIAKGNPPPRIHWTLDGFPVPQSERYVHNKLTFDLGDRLKCGLLVGWLAGLPVGLS